MRGHYVEYAGCEALTGGLPRVPCPGFMKPGPAIPTPLLRVPMWPYLLVEDVYI